MLKVDMDFRVNIVKLNVFDVIHCHYITRFKIHWQRIRNFEFFIVIFYGTIFKVMNNYILYHLYYISYILVYLHPYIIYILYKQIKMCDIISKKLIHVLSKTTVNTMSLPALSSPMQISLQCTCALTVKQLSTMRAQHGIS